MRPPTDWILGEKSQLSKAERSPVMDRPSSHNEAFGGDDRDKVSKSPQEPEDGCRRLATVVVPSRKGSDRAALITDVPA